MKRSLIEVLVKDPRTINQVVAKPRKCPPSWGEARSKLKANKEAAMTIGREVPDCLKRWKLQQDEMLQKKDANEELRKEELRAKAAQELADWHKQYEEQLEKKKSPVKVNQIICQLKKKDRAK